MHVPGPLGIPGSLLGAQPLSFILLQHGADEASPPCRLSPNSPVVFHSTLSLAPYVYRLRRADVSSLPRLHATIRHETRAIRL